MKRCETCMAREADPSEYHDDACPVFQEQAAYQVGHAAGYRAGIEAAARVIEGDDGCLPGGTFDRMCKEIRALVATEGK